VAFVVPQRQALGPDEVPRETEQLECLDERRIQMLRVPLARLGGRERKRLPDLLADAHRSPALNGHQYHS